MLPFLSLDGNEGGQDLSKLRTLGIQKQKYENTPTQERATGEPSVFDMCYWGNTQVGIYE